MPYNKDGEPISWKQVIFGKKKKTYIFWSIIVVMMALTIKDLFLAIKEHFEYNKSIDMVVRFNNSMSMPNITICMPQAQIQAFMDWGPLRNQSSNEARRAYWDGKIEEAMKKISTKEAFLEEKWPPEFLFDVFDTLQTLYMKEITTVNTVGQMLMFSVRNADENKRKKIQKYTKLFDDLGVTIEDARQKAGVEALGYQMRRLQRLTKNDELKILTWPKITWLSQEEFCWQPAFHDNSPVDFQGTFFTFTSVLNMQNLLTNDLDCPTADVSGRPSSFWRYHLNHGRENNGVVEDLCFGDRHDVTTTVKAYYRMVDDPREEDDKICRGYGEGEEIECHAKCRKEMVQTNLECTPITLEYLADEDELKKFPRCDYSNLKMIEPANITNTEKDCRAECHRDCNYIKYDVKKGVARHTSAIIAQTRAKSDPAAMAKLVKDLSQDVPHNELTVNFLFTSFEYMDCEQDYEETWVEFIGNVGGVLGLWLGLSAVSFIQAVIWMYRLFRPKEFENTDEANGPITRKLSSNPFGDVTLSQNPFGGVDQDLKSRRRSSMASN
ncbi:unnamed protein product [Bursaphelenchus xylophilus]|uniref:(pine wood nematode) hypothetical protein n=1 Tax=Bursaphelenchus xylophilus TaxID=6326 RepID=A0A1I7RIQ4_BURXY|nr:unnamed protein product [Bursaphelenchus xylophilus]CAG9119015.1 unnamed protein product [Bursaphelenchus xylophilus]